MAYKKDLTVMVAVGQQSLTRLGLQPRHGKAVGVEHSRLLVAVLRKAMTDHTGQPFPTTGQHRVEGRPV